MPATGARPVAVMQASSQVFRRTGPMEDGRPAFRRYSASVDSRAYPDFAVSKSPSCPRSPSEPEGDICKNGAFALSLFGGSSLVLIRTLHGSFRPAGMGAAIGVKMAEMGQTGPALSGAQRNSLSGHVSRSGAQSVVHRFLLSRTPEIRSRGEAFPMGLLEQRMVL